LRILVLAALDWKCYRYAMIETLTLVEEPADPELNRRMVRFQRNGEWLTEHGAPLFEQCRGRYIAVSEGEVFVADDYWQAKRLAKEKHPDDEPSVQYIPRERCERIYACPRPLAHF
jgi:hypothetical protein